MAVETSGETTEGADLDTRKPLFTTHSISSLILEPVHGDYSFKVLANSPASCNSYHTTIKPKG
jgi:hypothetical protein